jgi:DNA-binding CsgD family transcriptional regulator/tetratricopeptide (TPR) repeat protein
MGRTDTLLERDGELAEVAALVERARTGDGGVLLIEGPMGIGKTAILGAAAGLAAGALVLRGRGGEVERDLSFGLVRELFEPVLRAADPGARARWLSGAAGAAASVLAEAPGATQDAASVAFGLYWLLAAIADEQPVVLIADDLHECDPASLRWLAYLARRIDGLPVALLAATRPVERDPLRAIEGVRVIRPGPLGLGATGELVADRAGPAPEPVFIEACLAASGGNPMLLRELVETMRERGLAPDAEGARSIEALAGDRLGRAVLGRIGRLEPAAAALARALSVLGDGSELRHVAELAGIDPSAAVEALPALIAAGVLADEPALSFAHSLLRTAVYLELPAPVRAAEHRRAAALLQATGARPELVAHHLLLAEPVGAAWALAALHEAGELAIDQGAPESAAAYLRRALEEPAGVEERAELLRLLGNALVRLGEPAGVEVLEQALALTASTQVQAGIVDASIDPLLARGRMGEARRLLLDVLERDAVDAETRLTLMGRLALVHARDATDDNQLLDELRAMAPALDASTPARRYAAAALSLLHALHEGTAESAARLARIALDDRASREADASSWRPLYVARVALAFAGEPEEALAGLEDALAISRARGSLMGQGLGLGWRALIHALAGDVTAAENDGRASLALLSHTTLDAALQGATAATAWALIERGQLDEADALLEQAPSPFGWGASALACARVQLLIARHRYTEALIALAPVEQAGSLGPWTWRSLAVSASLGNGDPDAASVLADEDLIEARRFGSQRRIGSAMRVRAQIERGASGIALRGLAVEQLRRAGARLELARALVDLGAAIRRGGGRAASREPLLEGMELAARCGASALVEAARTELRAAGARPRSVVRSGLEALTPSERRVCGLAADGLANAEIAQALFVTVRTVEMHLSAAYRKLAISSRAELPRALAS